MRKVQVSFKEKKKIKIKKYLRNYEQRAEFGEEKIYGLILINLSSHSKFFIEETETF